MGFNGRYRLTQQTTMGVYIENIKMYFQQCIRTMLGYNCMFDNNGKYEVFVFYCI